MQTLQTLWDHTLNTSVRINGNEKTILSRCKKQWHTICGTVHWDTFRYMVNRTECSGVEVPGSTAPRAHVLGQTAPEAPPPLYVSSSFVPLLLVAGPIAERQAESGLPSGSVLNIYISLRLQNQA
jgi:hypothetical protein